MDRLRAAGWTWAAIAQAAGLTDQGVYYIRGARTVQRATYTAIMSIPVVDGDGMVDSLGSARRIQALMAIGWSQAECARRLKMTPQRLWHTMQHKRIRADKARAIDALFRELCMTPGKSVRARNYAHASGWPPPLGWDCIDDPNETPNLGDRYASFLERYEDAISIGIPLLELPRRLGLLPDSLAASMRRNNIPVPNELYSLCSARRKTA
ncbi:hypothetical protein [Mycolicibacterium canariasense]|nr:hypothetical protein [Mycolicibacterium canariasense]MCV7212632.1 DNA-binding protein [Mycolicibacterium canariasense]ORV02527.1 hypothetical protein AWB94_00885 [Mycolicibacterium canariasense]